MKSQFWFLVLALAFFMNLGQVAAKDFVHPGLSHKLSDLDRMKYMVQSKKDPWLASYTAMTADSRASYNYVVLGDTTKTVLYRDSPSTNLSAFEKDSRAAYYNALEWYITGDNRYANKAVEIFNAWTGLKYLQESGTKALTSCLIYQMLEAAEIIKSTYSGWKQADIDKFKAMLVYPGYSNTTVPTNLSTSGTWYWRGYMFDYVRAGNQELSAVRALLAMGVFLDNEIIYDRALRYVSGLPHRADDLPYSSGPHITGNINSVTKYQIDYDITVGNAIPDYGFNGVLTNYIYENGQSQESSRDQVHTMWGEGLLCSVSEIAWNQGSDLWESANSRILKGLEYNMHYSVSYVASYPDQTTAWTPTAESGEFIQGMDRTGRTKSLSMSPIYGTDSTRILRGTFNTVAAWELPLAHYVGRGFKTEDDAKWTTRARDKSIELNGSYETSPDNGAYLGYGGLTFRRADYCYGDPISGFDAAGLPVYKMNVAPCKMEAENFDYFSADGQGRVYNDLSGTMIANAYRKDSAVSIKTCSAGGYKIADMKNGEWLSYSVEFPEYSQYQFALNYSAANTGGAIKIQINGVDKTTEMTLPATGAGVWSDYVLPQTITLLSGVQSVRVYVAGTDNSIELNSISITKAMVPAANDYVSKASGDYNTGSSWYYSDGAGGYKSTQPYTAPTTATNVWIQEGHVMTAKANSKAKNLFVAGELTLGTSTTIANSLTLGTNTVTGSLYVLANGILTSTTANSGSMCEISLTGPTVQIDGQLGSASGTTMAGSGLSIVCENPATTTISGIGICNIARIISGVANVYNQEIVLDMDLNLTNGAINGAALSLLNGNAEIANKTLTINENKNVSFTGGSLGLLHQMSSAASAAYSGGDVTYNILGTLDTGNGGLYLTTSTMPASATQNININVEANGTLAIGSKFIIIKAQSTQAININLAEGSTVKYVGISTPVFSSTAATGLTATSFPTDYSNLVIESAKGLQLSNAISVNKSLTLNEGNIVLANNNLSLAKSTIINGGSVTSHVVANGTGTFNRSIGTGVESLFPVSVSASRYDPVLVNPLSDADISIRVDSVFLSAPDVLSLTNPVAWNISSSPAVVGKLSLLPSVMSNVNNPVIGQNAASKWYETEAVKDANGFSATLGLNGQFGTGTFSGFGQLSAIKNLELEKVKITVSGNKLLITNLSATTELIVFNSCGQTIVNKILDADSESIIIPSKGIYIVRLSSNDALKVVKLFVK